MLVLVPPVGATCPLGIAASRGGAMSGELRLQVQEEGADAERLAAVTSYLRAELSQLDVEDVARLPAGEFPQGARSAAVAAAGGLLVTLSKSPDSLRSVASAVWDWLRRGGGQGRKVRLELDGDVLELSRASAADQAELVELFVSRHSGGPASGRPA